ncbi:MAG: maleylacetoacetate isomerase [Sinobacteraceae bacterium]|nr:maleylacetoacetate isomerase [Nevskiaceae bacterium]
MRLHGYWRSSAAYRVRIAVRLKGLALEESFHALPKAEHRQDAFLALNPQGLVPALQTAQGVITQSMAIIEYLDEVFTEPRMLPADPYARAVVRGMAGIVCADVHPLNNLRVLNYLRAELGADEPRVNRWINHWISEGFQGLEALAKRHSSAQRFCFGDSATLADVCLVPQMFNARRFNCPLDAYPTLVAIDKHCRSLDAFRLAAPDLQPDAVLQ